MLRAFIVYASDETYNLKLIPHDRNISWQFRLLSETKSPNKYIFTFFSLFWCLTCGLNSDLTSNKLTHYLLDYGDFNLTIEILHELVDRFSRNFFVADLFIFSGILPEIYWKESAEETFFFFHISFWCPTWGMYSGFAYNKPTH